MFKIALRGWLLKLTAFGRYLDLALAICLLTLSCLYASLMLAGWGVVSMVAFLIDLNGRVQRLTFRKIVGLKKA